MVVGVGLAVALLAEVSLTVVLVALLLVAVALGVRWCADGMKIEVLGGGMRPLRTVDLIEFNSLDQLDAYDREQAARRR